MGTLWNTYAFFVLYANIDNFDASKYTLEYDKLSVMDKWLLSKLNSLIKDVDVFISMHRAEGFGLVMAEAMLNGTPVIATDWSSNTEFMNQDVACMVDYTFVTLKEDFPPYKAGAVWADPNPDTAADYMKKLYSQPEFYREKAQKAQTYIADKLSMSNAVELIEKRMEEIYD